MRYTDIQRERTKKTETGGSMFDNTSFGKYTDIAKRQLSVLKYREDIIANNIANVETPNFKRSTVNFETHLKEALESEKSISTFKAAKTNAAHIDFEQSIDYKTVTPRRFLDWQSQNNSNGNNVSIDQETSANIKNVLTYQLITKSINDSYKRINTVLR